MFDMTKKKNKMDILTIYLNVFLLDRALSYDYRGRGMTW